MGHRVPGKCPSSGTRGGGHKSHPPAKKLPCPTEAALRFPARCTLRFPALPNPTLGTGIGSCCQIKAARRGTARHSTARRARREGLANKPVQGGGRREARVIPLPKMLPLLTDGAAESWELRPGPAPGAPPSSPARPAQRRGSPRRPRPDSRPRGRRAGTEVPSGSPPRQGCGFRSPNPKPLGASLCRETQAAAGWQCTPRWGRGRSSGTAFPQPPPPASITYLWLQRPRPPHPKPSAGRCLGRRCRPSPGSPRCWPPGAGVRRPQVWRRLSRGTKRTPGKEAG